MTEPERVVCILSSETAAPRSVVKSIQGLELSLDLNALEDLIPSSISPEAPLVVKTSKVAPEKLVKEVIELDPQDVIDLITTGPARSYPTVQHIRAYHHVAALKLASGEKAVQVANSLSLTQSTICRLQQDPQFADLVEHYRGELVTKSINTFEMMELVAMESVSALHERLIGDRRGEIPLEALRRIGETFADRIGHSPVRRSESLSVSATGSISDIALERIKKLNPENARYSQTNPQQAALEAEHKAQAEDQGAETSIAALFKPVEKQDPKIPSSEGSGI